MRIGAKNIMSRKVGVKNVMRWKIGAKNVKSQKMEVKNDMRWWIGANNVRSQKMGTKNLMSQKVMKKSQKWDESKNGGQKYFKVEIGAKIFISQNIWGQKCYEVKNRGKKCYESKS